MKWGAINNLLLQIQLNSTAPEDAETNSKSTLPELAQTCQYSHFPLQSDPGTLFPLIPSAETLHAFKSALKGSSEGKA